MVKKWLCALALFALALGTLSAATVSFLIVETGIPEEAGRLESSSIWESGMMDAFFDAGHIVSNAPILRLHDAGQEKLPEEARREFDEARNGGADFFVMVMLDYPQGGNPAERPKKILLRVFSISSGQVVYETSIQGKANIGADEEFFEAKKTAGLIIGRLGNRG